MVGVKVDWKVYKMVALTAVRMVARRELPLVDW
jgi:hypothetical protein